MKQPHQGVACWLFTGVFMILIQILLGGITRLTGSGLSITEWNLLMGTLPPLNETDWNKAFEAYRQFPQYRIMNSDMTLEGFKAIFWWEYLHRLWARLFIPVFLIPLVYFLIRKRIAAQLLVQLAFIFLLGALQGLVGWIMVASGLIDRPWVDPVKLSIHFILALALLGYLFWVALDVAQPEKAIPVFSVSIKPLRVMLFLLCIQIFYGGLMAGHRAALFYPTFPKIGSRWIPEGLNTLQPQALNFVHNMGLIHLIHRGLGYLLAVVVIYFFFKCRAFCTGSLNKTVLNSLPVLVLLQVTLGVVTLLNSLGKIPVFYGVAHQSVAVLLLLALLFLYYQSRRTASQAG